MKKKIFIAFLLILAMVYSVACQKEKVPAEQLYTDYVAQNILPDKGFARLTPVHWCSGLNTDPDDPHPGLLGDLDFLNKGIISGELVDLDKDDVKELILCYADENPSSGNAVFNFDVYTIKDNKVEPVEFADEKHEFEFFYNSSDGNLDAYIQESDEKNTFHILKNFHHVMDGILYDQQLASYEMVNGKVNCVSYIENHNEDFNYSFPDKDMHPVARIIAVSNYLPTQKIQYFDATSIRSLIPVSDSKDDILKLYNDKIGTPDLENIRINWDENMETMFREMDESQMGVIASYESDINSYGENDLLVFYLDQEKSPYELSIKQQNLCIDLFVQLNGNYYFDRTVDIIEPVYPWSSRFCGSDQLSARIYKTKDSAQLCIMRASANEGPDQKAIYVYDLLEAIASARTVYYGITDGGRAPFGELMIPAHVNGGSSGEHYFICKENADGLSLYFEQFRLQSHAFETLYDTKDEALEAVLLELKDRNIDLKASEKNYDEILSWEYDPSTGKVNFVIP